MTVLEIYEKVNLILPVEQRRFFNLFEDTVSELLALYRNFVTENNEKFEAPKALSDENTVMPLYHGAIVDNIIFLLSGEESRKSEFIRKSREAYLKYWSDNAKGRTIKGRAWKYV